MYNNKYDFADLDIAIIKLSGIKGVIMKKTITSFSFMILCVYSTSGFEMGDVSAAFISHLKKTDSISTILSSGNIFTNSSNNATDSLLREILNCNPQLYGILRFSRDGQVLNDVNRDFLSNTSVNVKNRTWFQTPLKSGSPFVGGVLTANSNICFLKTYPLITQNITTGVLAILTDLKYCLGELTGNHLSPYTLFYDKAIVYQSDPSLSLTRIPIPEFGKLELIYNNTPLTHSPGLSAKNQRPEPEFLITNRGPFSVLLPWSITILTIAISLLVIHLSKPKIKKEELIALEYQKLSDETHKLIRDRAISQLYCEIRRQIETHEMSKIQQDVREKLALAYESNLVNGRKKVMAQ